MEIGSLIPVRLSDRSPLLYPANMRLEGKRALQVLDNSLHQSVSHNILGRLHCNTLCGFETMD